MSYRSLASTGLFDLTLPLQKVFSITETQRIQLRAEAFGLTNMPAFQSVSRSVTSQTFGEARVARSRGTAYS